MSSSQHSAVGIIGAGPYGLAVAAHLKFLGVEVRTFGSPMQRWLSQMPKQMYLKSEGCASSLYDPTGKYTLDRYCEDKSVNFSEYGSPVSRELVGNYGLSFQKTLVPDVENVLVSEVKKVPNGFELWIENGKVFEATKVVIATGLDHMAHIPDELAPLPRELLSHSEEHFDFSSFKGKDVVVIGGGQSALETAAILSEEGATVSLVVRAPSLIWHPAPSLSRKSLYERLRSPRSRLGDGRDMWVYDNLPGLFHHLPRGVRVGIVADTLGPAGSWWLKDRVVGRLPIHLGHRISSIKKTGAGVKLQIADGGGHTQELFADHVVAATGFRFKLNNLPFLGQPLKDQLLLDQQSPKLTSNFESSVPGLYFAGPAAANSFGPLMRFLAGAGFAAQRISHHLACNRKGKTRFAAPRKCSDT